MKKNFQNSMVGAARKVLLTMLLALGIGAVFILCIGQNPISAYAALFRGAFGGKLQIGTTLANFGPLLLTSLAFAIAAHGGAFNVGVEGEVYLGGIVAAFIGIYWTALPKPIMLIACFAGAMVIGALWAYIPGALKAHYNVSEVCTTILMNSVALYICSYLVNGSMSAGVANAQSKPVHVRLYQFMKPSSANVGLFISIAVVIVIIYLFYRSNLGFKLRSVGTNPQFSECMGINPKHVFINSMMLSGVLGGLTGCIEILGVHGYYLDNFATNLGFNGMLAALIAKNNLIFTPFIAFFLAILRSGALGMQQSTGVPKSIVDTITAIFIIFATMETLFQGKTREQKKALLKILAHTKVKRQSMGARK
ncbi:ABC transporter permease [Sediminispirochaeta bajacaliforniensis]|uniref:ABC transporter permease n=1 Tax=Sediminispirochaeta bajacaliforniensis TaxID=148 RepID=UPI0003A583A1|nr:ABC transporter permease [Sediminispirochaeta bajacaliforniensis]